jgi:hypothetical protein
LTFSNAGARDRIVSALRLEVRNGATGAKQRLEASYFAGPEYFSVNEDTANNIRRPKTPFAPLSVIGRGSHTATVLFYARKYEGQRVVSGGGRYELLLSAETKPVETLGFFDRLWSTSVALVRAAYELPQVSQVFEARIYSGNSERMFRAE